MKRERDADTIEAEMKKRQEILKKERDKIRSLNAELTTAKKREKAKRYNAIGTAIEEVLEVGELSCDVLSVLIDCFKRPVHTKDGTETTIAMRFANVIKAQRAKVSAAGNSTSAVAISANLKPEAVPSGRQGFTGTGNGSTLPFPSPAKP